MRFKEFLEQHVPSFPWLSLEKGPSYAILKLKIIDDFKRTSLLSIGQILHLHGYDVTTEKERSVADIPTSEGTNELHIYPTQSMSDIYDGADDALRDKLERIKSKELDKFLETLSDYIEIAFKLDESKQETYITPEQPIMLEGPLEDGMFKIWHNTRWGDNSRIIISRMMSWLLSSLGDQFELFDENKQPIKMDEIPSKVALCYVKPKSIFGGLFIGDNEKLKARLEKARTRVDYGSIFNQLEEFIYDFEYDYHHNDGSILESQSTEAGDPYPVSRDDFEISGPDDNGMWSIAIKNAKLETWAQRDALFWHLNVMKGLVRLILWTDVDEEISIYSPVNIKGLEADAFQITKAHHIPDYPTKLNFRPASDFPNMISGDDETRMKLIRRIATNRTRFMNEKLAGFLKMAVQNGERDYTNYHGIFDDDVDFD